MPARNVRKTEKKGTLELSICDTLQADNHHDESVTF
jgi:hypothetical protein